MMKKILFLLMLLIAFSFAGECRAVSVTATYSYDNINRLNWVAYQSGLNIMYGYDAAGNIISVSQSMLTPPDAPTITSIVAGSGRATIYFTPPANNGGSAITSYTATCTALGYETQTATGSGSPLIVHDLIAEVVYDCTVAATNNAGTSSASSAMMVTPTLKSDFPWTMFLPAITRGVK